MRCGGVSPRSLAGAAPLAGGDRLSLNGVAVPAGLLVLGAIGPALIAISTGVADLPRNDDWSYRSIAYDWYMTGAPRLDGASQSFALGQALLTLPLLWLMTGSHYAFFLFGILASICAALAGYALSRVVLGQSDAAIVVLTLFAAPGYLAYSHSYMTDVPALAGQLTCLACGAWALRSPGVRVRWVTAAIVAGTVAFSIRQFALAAPMAVCAAAVLAAPSRRSIAIVGGSILGFASVALVNASIAGQVGATPVLPHGPLRAASVVLSLALFLLPITLMALVRRRAAASWHTVGAGLVVAGFVAVVSGLSGVAPRTLGNLFSPWGVPASEYLIGGRPEILPLPLWSLVQVVALLATVLLVDALARVVRSVTDAFRKTRSVPPNLLLACSFVVIATTGLLGYAVAYDAFDRYLWPVIVPLGMILLWPTEPSRQAARMPSPGPGPAPQTPPIVFGVLPVLITISILYALNSYAFDRARWDSGWRLVEAGYMPSQIDAGYEWVGTFARGPARISDRQLRPPLGSSWYGNIWPEYHRCAIVAGTTTPPKGFRPLDVDLEGYRQFLIGGPYVPLLPFGSTDPACPSLPDES